VKKKKKKRLEKKNLKEKHLLKYYVKTTCTQYVILSYIQELPTPCVGPEETNLEEKRLKDVFKNVLKCPEKCLEESLQEQCLEVKCP